MERREDPLAEAEIPVRRLDLVEPLVHEAFLGVDGGRVRPPGVGHDRAEAGPVRLRSRADGAAPAAELEAAVGRPHGKDRVVPTDRGEAFDLWPAIARTDPYPPASLGQRADRTVDHHDLEGLEVGRSLAPGLDRRRNPVKHVERRLQLVGSDDPPDPLGPSSPPPRGIDRAIDQDQCSPDLGFSR
ncbi:MAG: hypothetical protein E6I45_11600 [Chloroflexi bacterium]|nr:MAG: hypothetical protein E6I45_11600 [Chloroflexota bacterium]